MKRYTPSLYKKLMEFIKEQQRKKRALKLRVAALPAGRKGVTRLRTAADIEDRFAFDGVTPQRARQNRQARRQRRLCRGF